MLPLGVGAKFRPKGNKTVKSETDAEVMVSSAVSVRDQERDREARGSLEEKKKMVVGRRTFGEARRVRRISCGPTLRTPSAIRSTVLLSFGLLQSLK